MRSARRAPARTSVLAVSLLLGGALLAGCSGGSSDMSADSGAEMSVEGESGGDEASASDAGAGIADSDAPVQDDREVITTGDVTVVTDDPLAAADEVAGLAEGAGGRVESRYQNEADGDVDASADLTIRVPADRTTATLDALQQVGDVRDMSVQADDVTGTARDLDARVEALTTSVDRLQTLMGSAETTEDLLAAEQELTARQAELESLQSQRASLTDQVAMSTLHVSIVAVVPPEELAPGGFVGGLRNGWDALLATVNVLVVVVGAILPWLAVALVVALVVRWVVRRVRRSREPGERQDPPAGTTGPDGDPDASPAAEAPLVGAGSPRD
ncbi:DUF4349 domain-containing protein [Cellulosimicrobium arenosum]|uniref:DUF4349 domain-containing protein n=1 Tax=Cellulosimicrobium arenosum TaxID=2708133 RepID=A0A927IXA0_9MICO|nr:DUF4349 domain-containing protein [Cellulosimicrobium arenosum]MBD8078036.1 DUF4349 domain-containing protein [Cellulosimicrobium arenosum]